jgi:hypothetical protein
MQIKHSAKTVKYKDLMSSVLLISGLMKKQSEKMAFMIGPSNHRLQPAMKQANWINGDYTSFYPT